MDRLNDPAIYANNSGLCGMQIQVLCAEDLHPPPGTHDVKEEETRLFSWKATAIGYPLGFFYVGAAMYFIGYFNSVP